MYAQAKDILKYKDKEYSITTQPLKDYLKENKLADFLGQSSYCHRGYIGYWEIKDDKLYLYDLNGTLANLQDVGIEYLFGNKTPVFASWYSGELKLEFGELFSPRTGSSFSIYEYNLFITINQGIVESERQVTNIRPKFERLIDDYDVAPLKNLHNQH